ncbi:hypothetical protein B0H14DRAFT_3130193 [Mycena olivaceomarginata]|nr:hypothetical protein B0H14DRAFT_3130193 [Mycena olivaceomarginata]
MLTWISQRMKRHPRIWHLLICIILTVIAVGVSVEVTRHLVLTDVDDRVPFTGSSEQQINLIANYIGVDATSRRATIDWFPLAMDCSESESSTEMIVNIFIDPNLLAPDSNSGTDSPGSTAPTSRPIFQFNTTEECASTKYGSYPIFRTVFKLTGIGGSGHLSARSGTLQAYPYDEYFFQISMLAQMASTNASVGIILGGSFGIPTNFDVILNKDHSRNNDLGLLLHFTVSRSTAVVGLVITIVVANWLVTVAFLSITVAAFMGDDKIVAEMFVLPIGTLFAFTAVRTNFPGAPEGFGAVIDYYGILPNLGLITLFTAVLLFRVLYLRIASSELLKNNKSSNDAESGNNAAPQQYAMAPRTEPRSQYALLHGSQDLTETSESILHAQRCNYLGRSEQGDQPLETVQDHLNAVKAFQKFEEARIG